MPEPVRLLCPTCGVALVVVPEKPNEGTCLQHGRFEFRARLHLDEP